MQTTQNTVQMAPINFKRHGIAIYTCRRCR